MDGVSLVVLTPEETLQRARGIAMSAKATTDIPAAIALPQALTLIEEEARQIEAEYEAFSGADPIPAA